MTPTSSPEPSGQKPSFLNDLGNQLANGREALAKRRRRNTMVASVAAVVALAGGGIFAVNQLNDDSPADIATGALDTSAPNGASTTTNVEPGPGNPPPSTDGDLQESDIEQYRCSVRQGRPDAPLDGAASTNPEVADIQQQRANVGLPSDEASALAGMQNDILLDSTVAENADMRLALGFPLTAEELNLVTGGGGFGQSVTDRVLDDETIRAELDAYIAEHDDTYAGRWIDGRRLGRPMAIAFAEDLGVIETRQNELDELFGEGLFIATQAEVPLAELEAIRAKIVALNTDDNQVWFGLGTYEQYGLVGVDLEVFDAASVQPIIDAVGTEHWCADGADPSDVVPEGPQPEAGDGWRLLFNEPTGSPYATWVATTQEQYDELIDRLDPSDAWPEAMVDFDAEIVVWFGAVYSGSCPEIRLDDVAIVAEAALVHADIVNIGGARACTSDANPRAYVVALDRSALPPAPFAVQLSETVRCRGCGGTERTEVSQAMLDGSDEPPSLDQRLPQRGAPDPGDGALLDLAEAAIGLSEEDALEIIRSNGFEARVVVRDGAGQDREDDLREDRLNLIVVDGVVAQAVTDEGLNELDASGNAPSEPEPTDLWTERAQGAEWASVTASLFSGRPNPEIVPSAQHAATVLDAAAALPREPYEESFSDPSIWQMVMQGESDGQPITIAARPGRVSFWTDGGGEVVIADPQSTVLLAMGKPMPALLSDSATATLVEINLFVAANPIIGAPEAAAIETIDANGYPVRVVEREGEGLPVTKDLRPNRLNLVINDGLVTSFTLG